MISARNGGVLGIVACALFWPAMIVRETLNIGAVLLVIVTAFIVGGRLPGGLAQRLVDAIVFAWFLAVSVRLIRLERRRNPVSAVPRRADN